MYIQGLKKVSNSCEEAPLHYVGELFPPLQKVHVEVPERSELNFTASVPVGAPARVVQPIAAMLGLDDDQITEMVTPLLFRLYVNFF